MPVKVYELAKELKMTNTEMVSTLSELGFKGFSPSSDLEEETAQTMRDLHKSSQNGAAAEAAAADKAAVIDIPENVSVKELAERLLVGANEIQKVLMSMGVLAALNQRLAPDAVLRIAQKLGKTVRTATPVSVARAVGTAVAVKAAPRAAAPAHRSPHGLAPRPPVVTIMGHVDHGKTTLLDAIRKTNVVGGEAGGITQHIGAYQVELEGKRITFLDTPGHAAFTAMRARGAQVTDIVIIVVAADDGVMPQTEEAIQHAKAAKVPLIIAVNKIDLPGANPDRVLTELMNYDLVPEVYGGNVVTANISAKKGTGIPELLESILLVSELVVEPKADPHGKAQGTVIEAQVDKGRGPVATVLVQQGTLRLGDVVVAGESFGKIRGMNDDKGGKVTKAGPSTPVELVGFSAVPFAGDRLEVVKDEKEARAIAERRTQRSREDRFAVRSRVTLEDLYRQMREGAIKELNVVIKGDVQGSVEAVRDSLEKLENPEVRVRVLSTGVGPISENDVLLAAAGEAGDTMTAIIVGFNVGVIPSAKDKAEQEHVEIRTYSIIYALIDDVKNAMLGLLEPIYEESPLGKAEVRQRFKLPSGVAIAGCYVTEGLLRRNAKIRLRRGDQVLFTGNIDSLKRIKEDAREVLTGFECGLTLHNFNDIDEGDILECFELKQIARDF